MSSRRDKAGKLRLSGEGGAERYGGTWRRRSSSREGGDQVPPSPGEEAERRVGSETRQASSRGGARSGRAAEAGQRPGAGVGRGLTQGRGSGRAGTRPAAGQRVRGRGAVSAVESFSGYAVRHLKPEVTQNWRVGRAAC